MCSEEQVQIEIDIFLSFHLKLSGTNYYLETILASKLFTVAKFS